MLTKKPVSIRLHVNKGQGLPTQQRPVSTDLYVTGENNYPSVTLEMLEMSLSTIFRDTDRTFENVGE